MKWSADVDIDLYVVHDPSDNTCAIEAIDEIKRGVVDIRRAVPGLGRLGNVRAVTQVPQATGRPSIVIVLPTENASLRQQLDSFAALLGQGAEHFTLDRSMHVYDGIKSERQPMIVVTDFDIGTTIVAESTTIRLAYSWTINKGGILWSDLNCLNAYWSSPLYDSLGAINFNAAALALELGWNSDRRRIQEFHEVYARLQIAFLRVLYDQPSSDMTPDALRIALARTLNNSATRPRLD